MILSTMRVIGVIFLEEKLFSTCRYRCPSRKFHKSCNRGRAAQGSRLSLKQFINQLESKEAKLLKTLSEFQENDTDNNNSNLEITHDRLFSEGEGNHRIIDTGDLSNTNLTLEDMSFYKIADYIDITSNSR